LRHESGIVSSASTAGRYLDSPRRDLRELAKENIGAVFTMFSQIGATRDPVNNGLGIGLNLVCGLAQMHGGSVEVRSDGEGKGSEFVLRLPCSPAASQSA
jgi:signal transduction histidine kinase